MRRAERAGVVERGREVVRWVVVVEGRRGARRPVRCGRIVVEAVVAARRLFSRRGFGWDWQFVWRGGWIVRWGVGGVVGLAGG